MARERYNRGARKGRKQDKLIRQSMVTHESRLPTLRELRDTVEGIEQQANHFDEDFGFKSFAAEEAEMYDRH